MTQQPSMPFAALAHASGVRDRGALVALIPDVAPGVVPDDLAPHWKQDENVLALHLSRWLERRPLVNDEERERWKHRARLYLALLRKAHADRQAAREAQRTAASTCPVCEVVGALTVRAVGVDSFAPAPSELLTLPGRRDKVTMCAGCRAVALSQLGEQPVGKGTRNDAVRRFLTAGSDAAP